MFEYLRFLVENNRLYSLINQPLEQHQLDIVFLSLDLYIVLYVPDNNKELQIRHHDHQFAHSTNLFRLLKLYRHHLEEKYYIRLFRNVKDSYNFV